MAYTIIIAEAAEKDVREAFIWYEKQKPNLGNLFEKQMTNAIESIQKNPRQFQVKYGITRVLYLNKFPFGIHYQIVNKDIYVLAVFHTSLDPKKWKR